MRTPPRIGLALFDFDGVLAHYRHEARLSVLAQAAGCTPARVTAVLFESGLERTYDSGRIDTDTYLQRLGEGLGGPIDAATWIGSRIAGSRADPAVSALVAAVAERVPVGVLSNNGALMMEAMRGIVPSLFPLLDGRVRCSGAIGVRKPERTIFEHALARFGAAARETLFLDDLFVNVQGARAAGLHADTVVDARSMRTVLRRYGLA